MDVSILDVETTVKPKQSQHIRWQINDFNNFYNSQAGQLTQHFGPLPIDNLKFSLQIRKRTDCQLNFQAILSKEFGDCDLGLLKIELKNGAGKKFEEHFLNLNQPDQYFHWQTKNELFRPNSIFCVDMLYENVQVQTQIRQTDSHLDTEETSHIVTSKSSTADSFEMVSQNGSESDYRHEIKALHLQETQPTKVTGEWTEQESGAVSDEELEGMPTLKPQEKASSTRLSTRSSTPQCNLEKVALCTVRIQTPNEEKEGELTSQEVKSEEDYDFDDSLTLDDPNCTDEQKQEQGNRFGTNDDDLKLKRQLTDPDLPVFIGSVPDAEVGVLQKVILAIYSKFRERIQYLIAEYLKGNTAVTASIIGMTDEIFDTIRDLETLIGEFEEKQVEEGNADDYDKFLAELRKRFPEDKSLAESVKTLIFAEIRRHFALAAELEQLNNQIHSLRKKYSSTTEQQKRLDLCQRLKKIELETSVLEEKLDDLLVPEFVDQKKLKTNLDNLQRLINHYNAELEAESDQNGGAFIHQKLDECANANWEKIVDINEEVQQTHEELNVLLEELEEDRGSTVKEMSDNLNLLDTLYEHKIKHTGKLIRNARHNCTADHFQSSKMLHKAEKLIQKLSTSQQRVGNALNILRKDLQEALDKKANESVFS